MAPFPGDFLENQKTRLLEEKASLEKQISQLKERPDYGSFSEEDNIRELVDFENNQSLESQLELVLKRVNAALEAIDNGTYGMCEVCGSAIESNKLSIMPYAEICVSCQRAQNEKSKKR